MEQRGGEALDAFAFDHDAARRAATGQHDEIGIEPERGQVAGTDQPVAGAVG